MADGAKSDHPAVQKQLDRLSMLSPGRDVLGLERISEVLHRLDNPHEKLPPVFHVAGTNGKGSTCAFLRAAIEAEGLKAHVYTSPHLVRFNERIRVAGNLIADDYLAELLARVLDISEDINPSFFEATTAAAFLAFAEHSADACILEVGLGGRLDATNVVRKPACTGIAALGIDHEQFLLAPESGVPVEPMARIAFEKAGIAKPGVPLVTHYYSDNEANWAIEDVAESIGAPLYRSVGEITWRIKKDTKGQLRYLDYQGYGGREKSHTLPLPQLAGEHQVENAGLAIAMLRHQKVINVSMNAIANGISKTSWPGRLQKLSIGPLVKSREVWLDGGHNESAGFELWQFVHDNIFVQNLSAEKETPVHLIVGMLTGKNPDSFLKYLRDLSATITVVPVPNHDSHTSEAFGSMANAAPDVASALASLPDDDLPVLIAGSLYLAGDVLRANEQVPD